MKRPTVCHHVEEIKRLKTTGDAEQDGDFDGSADEWNADAPEDVPLSPTIQPRGFDNPRGHLAEGGGEKGQVWSSRIHRGSGRATGMAGGARGRRATPASSARGQVRSALR